RGPDPDQLGACLVALGGPGGSGRKAGGGAAVDEGPALVGLAVVEEEGADDDVGEAVAVDVACGRDGDAELGARLVALGGPGGRGQQAGDGAVVDEGTTFVGLAVVVEVGTDDDVGEPVAVDVAGGRHGDAEVGTRLI